MGLDCGISNGGAPIKSYGFDGGEVVAESPLLVCSEMVRMTSSEDRRGEVSSPLVLEFDIGK
jgi:hypothetical protein